MPELVERTSQEHTHFSFEGECDVRTGRKDQSETTHTSFKLTGFVDANYADGRDGGAADSDAK